MRRITFALALALFLLVGSAAAQKADVTVSLNEPFFDALLDSIYQNFDPPEFSIASANTSSDHLFSSSLINGFAGNKAAEPRSVGCSESIKILREMNGVRTAVRFRDGKVYVPLAFSGSYAAPLVGCIEFAGWAESNIDLEFDKDGQRLIGRIHVTTVNLNGTGGIGGSLVAKMLQGSIDKKLNPIEVLTLDKLTFAFPVAKSGNLAMKATSVRNEIANGALNVVVTYQFGKS